MHPQHFDRVARQVANPPSRRGLIRRGVAAVATTLLGRRETAAACALPGTSCSHRRCCHPLICRAGICVPPCSAVVCPDSGQPCPDPRCGPCCGIGCCDSGEDCCGEECCSFDRCCKDDSGVQVCCHEPSRCLAPDSGAGEPVCCPGRASAAPARSAVWKTKPACRTGDVPVARSAAATTRSARRRTARSAVQTPRTASSSPAATAERARVAVLGRASARRAGEVASRPPRSRAAPERRLPAIPSEASAAASMGVPASVTASAAVAAAGTDAARPTAGRFPRVAHRPLRPAARDTPASAVGTAPPRCAVQPRRRAQAVRPDAVGQD
jgi:hypothetical protein